MCICCSHTLPSESVVVEGWNACLGQQGRCVGPALLDTLDCVRVFGFRIHHLPSRGTALNAEALNHTPDPGGLAVRRVDRRPRVPIVRMFSQTFWRVFRFALISYFLEACLQGLKPRFPGFLSPLSTLSASQRGPADYSWRNEREGVFFPRLGTLSGCRLRSPASGSALPPPHPLPALYEDLFWEGVRRLPTRPEGCRPTVAGRPPLVCVPSVCQGSTST